MDKNIDLIINSKFIRSQQTHHKSLHHMDLQETIVLIIKRERERKSSSYELRTRRSTKNYSHIIGETPMEVVNPIRDGI